MGLVDWITVAVIALILGGAVAYIVREKKKGKKCIGCPYSDGCVSPTCQCHKNERPKTDGTENKADHS